MLLQMALFHSSKYSIVYMYHLFIYSSIHGHFSCFHVLAIVNSPSVNIGVHVSFLLRVYAQEWDCRVLW